jgi:alpha-glucosidase
VARDGWSCWALSNHDVVRHATRWGKGEPDKAAWLKVISALLMSLRGSLCIYQGEELGLEEAELAFEDLRDPYGIRFWPEFKGRDGCRTPMVWEKDAPNGGFSSGKPWLPVPEIHRQMAVDTQAGREKSLLEHYRRFLGFRRSHPVLAKGDIDFLAADNDILVFVRESDDDQLICAFNFGARPAALDLGDDTKLQSVDGHGFAGSATGGKITLGGYGAWFGRMV